MSTYILSNRCEISSPNPAAEMTLIPRKPAAEIPRIRGAHLVRNKWFYGVLWEQKNFEPTGNLDGAKKHRGSILYTPDALQQFEHLFRTPNRSILDYEHANKGLQNVLGDLVDFHRMR